MIRAALVGCGKIADQHAEQIGRLPDCAIAAVCDNERLMAQQLADRFKVPQIFDEVDEMLDKVRPDVVHITTPPQSHSAIGCRCLQAGCHLYVEKPFTVDAQEAVQLLEQARERDRKVTVGHNYLFSEALVRLRKLVQQGGLGGSPVHLEGYYCYDLGDPAYAKSFLGDSEHWLRQLPGGLLQNIISHGIASIVEYLAEPTQVIVHGHAGPALERLGADDLIDELRVILVDEEQRTAYFTFSSQMKPRLHQLRIFGPQDGLLADEDLQTVIRLRGKRYKSYLHQFLPQWGMARQYASQSLLNMWKFLRADFHQGEGMRRLIGGLYQSIRTGGPPPIPYREILRTARVMDRIFEQLPRPQAAEVDAQRAPVQEVGS